MDCPQTIPMDSPVDCSNGLSADYSDGLSGGLHCPAGQSPEWSLDSLRKIVPVSTMKFYNFPDYCPVRTMWGTVKTSDFWLVHVLPRLLLFFVKVSPSFLRSTGISCFRMTRVLPLGILRTSIRIEYGFCLHVVCCCE